MADFWELVCASPPGGVESVVNESSSIDVQLDQRHLMLRGDTVSHMTYHIICHHLPIALQSVPSSFCCGPMFQGALLQPKLRGGKHHP